MLISDLINQSAPISQAQQQQLDSLLGSLTPVQQAWVQGYVAAATRSAKDLIDPPWSAAAGQSQKLTILYGSQTGNARTLAVELAALCNSAGVTASAVDMAEYKNRDLKKESYLIVVTATYGEGEPPENAVEFYNFLYSKKAPSLESLYFSVLGLGDSSYEFFCKTALDFHARLEQLGGRALLPCAELDVDYEEPAGEWSLRISQLLNEHFANSSAETKRVSSPSNSSLVVYNKKTPYQAELYTQQRITGRGSAKDIRHLELSLGDSGLTYQPGDSLGVCFLNPPGLVHELLKLTSVDPNQEVMLDGSKLTVFDAIQQHKEITRSYPGFVEFYAKHSQSERLDSLLKDKAELNGYLQKRQIIDLVRELPCALNAQSLVDGLRKIQPRLYSIASSQNEVEDEVHITVAVVRYEAFGSQHTGGASSFLADQITPGAKVRVYIEENKNFRLPEDDQCNVIMIGPGTGVAPFRAFLQEREQRGAQGGNWLFFGNPTFTEDFLYQLEWQRYLKSGLLTRLDLAFSRDQQEKVYVQHRLKEQGEAIFDWLQSGAYIYVCGDALRMARDVEAELLNIIELHGNKTAAEAADYLKQLKQQKRYQKDVY